MLERPLLPGVSRWQECRRQRHSVIYNKMKIGRHRTLRPRSGPWSRCVGAWKRRDRWVFFAACAMPNQMEIDAIRLESQSLLQRITLPILLFGPDLPAAVRDQRRRSRRRLAESDRWSGEAEENANTAKPVSASHVWQTVECHSRPPTKPEIHGRRGASSVAHLLTTQRPVRHRPGA